MDLKGNYMLIGPNQIGGSVCACHCCRIFGSTCESFWSKMYKTKAIKM